MNPDAEQLELPIGEERSTIIIPKSQEGITFILDVLEKIRIEENDETEEEIPYSGPDVQDV